MKINIDILKKASNSLLFSMSEQQYVLLLEEFDVLIKQLSLLDDLGSLEAVEPLDFPYEIELNTLREDNPSKPVNRRDILGNAGDSYANQIKLPKVVK